MQTKLNSIQLALSLIFFYNVLEAHVCDIHPKSPREEKMIEDEIDRQKDKEDEKTLSDPDSSDDDRRGAIAGLSGREKMV